MGKGDRRGKFKPLPELAVIPKRLKGADKRYREPTAKRNSDKDPQKTVLSARCRHFGIDDTPRNRLALSGPHMGSELGFVIEAHAPKKEASHLWGVWTHYATVRSQFLTRIIGVNVSPKGAAVAFVHEDIIADPDARVDTRSKDQKDRDAIMAWERMLGAFVSIPKDDRQLLENVLHGTGKALWVDGSATRAGRATLDALRNLSEAMRG